MTIRLATNEDIPAIMPVIDAAREMMHASGNREHGSCHRQDRRTKDRNHEAEDSGVGEEVIITQHGINK